MYQRKHFFQSGFAALLCLFLLSACGQEKPLARATATEIGPGNGLAEQLYRAEQRAKEYALRLGLDLTGVIESIPPQQIPNTNDYMVCFSNVVVRYSETNAGEKVYLELMSVPLLLGEKIETPVSEQESKWFEFVPTGSDGYMVLIEFKKYIEEHGGMEISGPPINHGGWMPGDVRRFRQCFKNYCLILDLIDGKLVISVEPNGHKYCDGLAGPTPAPAEPQITIQPWFNMPAYNKGLFEYGVVAYSDLNGEVKVAGVETRVTLSVPEQESRTYVLPPTGADGQSVIPLSDFQVSDNTPISALICIRSELDWYCHSEQVLYRSSLP